MKKLALPLQLLLLLLLAAVVSMSLPVFVVQALYTVSFLINRALFFFLPCIVFFFVSSGVLAFAHNSLAMVLLLLGLVTVSNMVAGLYTYVVGGSIIQGWAVEGMGFMSGDSELIEPLLSFPVVSYISSENAMMSALLVGLVFSFVSVPTVTRFLTSGKALVEWGLSSLFIPVLPIYIFGFFLKMFREVSLWQLCGAYGAIFALSVVMQVMYLMALYFISHKGQWRAAAQAFITALPSYMTALGTMSSVATLPVSLVCAEKNTKNKALAHFAMPMMANFHLVGDAVCVPLFSLATMKLFFGVMPGLMSYLFFMGYVCLTMLAVSGIPGGGIIMMLPVLKSFFSFTPEMLSIMTALYLLQDGFGTAANVMGDGALVSVLDKISRWLGLVKKDAV